MAATYKDELDASDDIIDFLDAIDPTPTDFTDALTTATRRLLDHIEKHLRIPSRVLHLWDWSSHRNPHPRDGDSLWNALVRSTRLQLRDEWEYVPLEALDLWLTTALERVGVEREDATDVHEGFMILRERLARRS